MLAKQIKLYLNVVASCVLLLNCVGVSSVLLGFLACLLLLLGNMDYIFILSAERCRVVSFPELVPLRLIGYAMSMRGYIHGDGCAVSGLWVCGVVWGTKYSIRGFPRHKNIVFESYSLYLFFTAQQEDAGDNSLALLSSASASPQNLSNCARTLRNRLITYVPFDY